MSRLTEKPVCHSKSHPCKNADLLQTALENKFSEIFFQPFNPALREYLRSILNQGKKKKAIDTLCIKDATSPDMTASRQDEKSPSASPAVVGSASRPAIYNSKADKWQGSGPLISVNWMWRHFFTAVRYGTSPEDIRGGCWIGIFNVLITGRVDDDRSCSKQAEDVSEALKSIFVPLSEEETNTLGSIAVHPRVRGVKTVALSITDRT